MASHFASEEIWALLEARTNTIAVLETLVKHDEPVCACSSHVSSLMSGNKINPDISVPLSLICRCLSLQMAEILVSLQ